MAFVAALGASPLSGQSAGLVVYGDVVYLDPPGNARNCILNSRFKRGEPVGFRMTAINPANGKRDWTTQMVVHLSGTRGKPLMCRCAIGSPMRSPSASSGSPEVDGSRRCADRDSRATP